VGPKRRVSNDSRTLARVTAERYGERIARLTQRWVNAVPYDTSRMTEHEARALWASLRD